MHIVDRAKDIIIRGGENISSVEVEDALAGAPGVAEAAVIAVPDDVMGEKVGAVVVAGRDLDVDAVIAHVSARIADFKVPQYLTVWDGPLPRNPGGKMLKAQLRQQVSGGSRCDDHRAPADDARCGAPTWRGGGLDAVLAAAMLRSARLPAEYCWPGWRARCAQSPAPRPGTLARGLRRQLAVAVGAGEELPETGPPVRRSRLARQPRPAPAGA